MLVDHTWVGSGNSLKSFAFFLAYLGIVVVKGIESLDWPSKLNNSSGNVPSSSSSEESSSNSRSGA